MRQNKKEEEPLPTLISSSLALLLSCSFPSISYSSLQTLMHSIILKRKSEQVINQMGNNLKSLYEKKIEGLFFNLSSIKLLFSDLLSYEKGILALFENLEKSAKKEGFLSKVLFETFKKKMDFIYEALFNEIGREIETWRKGEGRKEEGGWINRMLAKFDEIDEGVFYKKYEEFLLSESRIYYEKEKENGKQDFIEYLRFCRERHEKELEIAQQFLQPKSRPNLLSLFNSLYIFPHNTRCFENSLPLSALGDFLYFSVFSPELFSSFLQSFAFHLSSSLSSLLPDKIDEIFALFAKFKEFIRNFERTLPKDSFSTDFKSSEKTVELSMISRYFIDKCEYAISLNLISNDLKNVHLSPLSNTEKNENERLPLYLLALKDTFISSFIRTLNDSTNFSLCYIKWLDKKLSNRDNYNLDCNEVFKFFDFINEKDRFLLIYEKHLSKRLLRKRADLLKEEEALKLLAEKIGTSLVSRLFSKLEDFRKALVLFDDYRIFAKEDNTASPFNTSKKLKTSSYASFFSSDNHNIDFSFVILAQNLWPYDVSSFSSIPTELIPYFEHVESWYKGKFQGRKLVWLEEEEEGILILRNKEGGKENKKVELICDRGVAKVLINLNREGRRNREEEEEKEKEILKIFGYLCQRKVLSRTNEGFRIHEELGENGGRVINLNRNRRRKEEKENNKEERERVIVKEEEEIARRIRVESLIMRIMKIRKKIRMTELFGEVKQQELSFRVEKLWFESLVEGLAGREYLEKVKDEIIYIN